jgi:L-asparaginase II
MPVPLVKVQRGKIIESIHYGDVVAVDRNGTVIYAQGSYDTTAYFRSASKPLQAIAALLKGIREEYNLSEEEVALLCGSHSGEDIHVQTARSLMSKTGICEDMLQLEPTYPSNAKAAEAAVRSGGKSKIFHNCIGKHIAMIAQCNMLGYDTGTYYLPAHPVQQWNRQVIGRFCGIDPERIAIGCDGCGVPVFAAPLKNMAAAFQKLATGGFPEMEYANACRTARIAMTNHPYIIAGEGRFDYILMELANGRAVAKTGAEGLFCIGLPEEGVGIAIKLSDGGQRGMECIIARVMDVLGCLNDEIAGRLIKYAERPVLNHRGENVGRISTFIH